MFIIIVSIRSGLKNTTSGAILTIFIIFVHFSPSIINSMNELDYVVSYPFDFGCYVLINAMICICFG